MKSAENTAVTDRVLKEHEFESHFSFDIRPHVRVTEYEKGEYIIRNTDQLTRILYLVQGTAKLYVFHKKRSGSLRNNTHIAPASGSSAQSTCDRRHI